MRGFQYDDITFLVVLYQSMKMQVLGTFFVKEEKLKQITCFLKIWVGRCLPCPSTPQPLLLIGMEEYAVPAPLTDAATIQELLFRGPYYHMKKA